MQVFIVFIGTNSHIHECNAHMETEARQAILLFYCWGLGAYA